MDYVPSEFIFSDGNLMLELNPVDPAPANIVSITEQNEVISKNGMTSSKIISVLGRNLEVQLNKLRDTSKAG